MAQVTIASVMRPKKRKKGKVKHIMIRPGAKGSGATVTTAFHPAGEEDSGFGGPGMEEETPHTSHGKMMKQLRAQTGPMFGKDAEPAGDDDEEGAPAGGGDQEA